MVKEKTKVQEPASAEFVKMDNSSHILYSNQVNISVSPYDMKFDFSIIVKMDGNIFGIDNIATVMMSPQHAKSFAKLLNSQVNLYEESFGKLPDEK